MDLKPIVWKQNDFFGWEVLPIIIVEREARVRQLRPQNLPATQFKWDGKFTLPNIGSLEFYMLALSAYIGKRKVGSMVIEYSDHTTKKDHKFFCSSKSIFSKEQVWFTDTPDMEKMKSDIEHAVLSSFGELMV